MQIILSDIELELDVVLDGEDVQIMSCCLFGHDIIDEIMDTPADRALLEYVLEHHSDAIWRSDAELRMAKAEARAESIREQGR